MRLWVALLVQKLVRLWSRSEASKKKAIFSSIQVLERRRSRRLFVADLLGDLTRRPRFQVPNPVLAREPKTLRSLIKENLISIRHLKSPSTLVFRLNDFSLSRQTFRSTISQVPKRFMSHFGKLLDGTNAVLLLSSTRSRFLSSVIKSCSKCVQPELVKHNRIWMIQLVSVGIFHSMQACDTLFAYSYQSIRPALISWRSLRLLWVRDQLEAMTNIDSLCKCQWITGQSCN